MTSFGRFDIVVFIIQSPDLAY